MAVAVTEGQLSSGLPYLQLGKGPPLFPSPGLSFRARQPERHVAAHGTVWGGAACLALESVALQLAIDHPHVVRRLVVAAAACRLDPSVRD